MARRRGQQQQQEESGGFTGPPDFGVGLGDLMALLGIGSKGALEQRRLDLDELQALAQAGHYAGDIREKAATRELAGEEMRLRQQEALENAKARAAAAEAAGRTDEFQREMKRVATDEATATRQLNEAKLIADLPDTVMSPAEKREYYKTLGKAGESMLRVEEGKQRTETKGFKKGLETAYKTGKPEAVKEYLKGRETAAEALPEGTERLEAMMRDPSIDWQALNAGMPAPQPGIWERLFGGNRAAAAANAAPEVAAATPPQTGNYGLTSQPSTYRYGTGTLELPTINPEEVGYAARAMQMPQYNFYEEGYPSAQPDYTYGIQTPVPGLIAAKYDQDPAYMPVEQEMLKKAMDWWARQQQAAPTGLVDGAEQESYPYRYGVGNVAVPEPPPNVGGGPSLWDRISGAMDWWRRSGEEEAQRLPHTYGGLPTIPINPPPPVPQPQIPVEELRQGGRAFYR